MLLAVTAPVVLLRAALMFDQRMPLASADLRGFSSDLLVALAVYAVCLWLARRTYPGAVLLTLAWYLLNFANYEHISTLGASADISQISYLFDPTFFRGSALSLSSPGLFLALGGAVALLLWLAARPGRSKTLPWRSTLTAAAGLLLLSRVPLSGDALHWRQANFIDDNLLQLIRPVAARSASNLTDGNREALSQLYSRDLSGSPITAPAASGHNVLLVILEGISGVHLASLASVHGIDNAIKLQALDTVAVENLSYSTFIAHNRQTNRGEYAILCGDLPVLENAEPKMTRVLAGDDITCLPDILRAAGYQTAYLQAAPLGFMSKDAFMPMAGFSEVHGESWFPMSYASNQWGIDDRAFLMQATQKIAQLQQEQAPWFLTLLTVGTHHPYIVPGSFGSRNFPEAARYLDTAFAEFMQKIRRMKVLEDTLVIITSDESVGITGYRGAGAFTKGLQLDDVTRKITDNWGFLIALTPERDRQRIDEPFSQSDIATSILDYLGLAGVSNLFIGRSIFRSYESLRAVVFGNLYKKYLGYFDPQGGLQLCPEDLSAPCEGFSLPPGALFSTRRVPGQPAVDAAGFLRAVLGAAADSRPADRLIPLTREPIVPVRQSPGMQVLFGGQYLSTDPNTRISVDIDVTLRGPTGTVRAGILLQSDQGKLFSRAIPPLHTGERLRLAFDYYAPEAMESLALIGTVIPVEGSGMTLEFEKATLRAVLVPAGVTDGSAGLSVRTLEVSHAN